MTSVTRAGLVFGLGGACGLAAALYVRYLYKQKIVELESSLGKEKKNRHDDRKGRTEAEKELRLLRSRLGSCRNDQGDSSQGSLLCRHVGYVDSVFASRYGTPRQGGVVASSRAAIKLVPSVVPSLALENMDEFSHAWLIFVFHENTNLHKNSVKGKVKPPRLDGKKVGLFSCRTPHRPNAIGISVVKIESIDSQKGVLFITNHDLVDGTPILDIKPYLPNFDALSHATTPDWAHRMNDPVTVTFETTALNQLCVMVGELRFYSDADEAQQGIEDVLSNDIRSVYRRQIETDSSGVCTVGIDTMWVDYEIVAKDSARVIGIRKRDIDAK